MARPLAPVPGPLFPVPRFEEACQHIAKAFPWLAGECTRQIERRRAADEQTESLLAFAQQSHELELEEARAAGEELICTACGMSVPRPAPCQWTPMWEAGWRWIGTLDLYSCPECPPVVLVEEDGRHVRGPGAEAQPVAPSSLPSAG